MNNLKTKVLKLSGKQIFQTAFLIGIVFHHESAESTYKLIACKLNLMLYPKVENKF